MYFSLSTVNLSKELQVEKKCRVKHSHFKGMLFSGYPRMLRPDDPKTQTTPRQAGCFTVGIGRMLFKTLGAVRNHWDLRSRVTSTVQRHRTIMTSIHLRQRLKSLARTSSGCVSKSPNGDRFEDNNALQLGIDWAHWIGDV